MHSALYKFLILTQITIGRENLAYMRRSRKGAYEGGLVGELVPGDNPCPLL